MKNIHLILFFFFFSSIHIFAQTPNNEQVFMQKMKNLATTNKAQTALELAKSFIGKPYKAGTLEGNSKEDLVCNLQSFDCWTFVENITAMTLIKHEFKNPTYEQYKNQLKKLRYRNGIIDGYGSRLHYFKEWINQAENNKYVIDKTKEIGGISANKYIDFMTTHSELYTQLKDSKNYKTIENAQKNLNSYDFYYIPKSKVSKIENQIQEGDIIGITSTVAGLDFNHEGFAIKQNGRIHLLHASLDGKKIMISNEPLADYLNTIKKHAGITVVRFL